LKVTMTKIVGDYETAGPTILSRERLRDLLGVPPGKLTRGPDFERRVIEPALLVSDPKRVE
jgi:hypothetical protein